MLVACLKFQEHVRSVAARACQKFQEHVSSVSEVPSTCESVASRACQKVQKHVTNVASRAFQTFFEKM